MFIISCEFVHYKVINFSYIMLTEHSRERQKVGKMYEPEGSETEESRLGGAQDHGGDHTDPLRDGISGYEFIGETDRESGEYHYKNGYTQKIYSDAHYVPADENTVPPRYYTPPEKPVREPKQVKPRRRRKNSGKTVSLCLACLLVGGLAGSAMVGNRLAGRIDSLESRLEALSAPQETAGIGLSISPVSTAAPVSSGGISAGQIYQQACRQVVGVTTEVTYTNIFGMTSSSSVDGSGLVISADGYILTNYHVIEKAYANGLAVTVMFKDGTQYEASIVGFENDGSDVAVLKIEAAGLSPVAFGDSDRIGVGEDVFVVGNPLGELEFSQTQGHISALNRLITTDSGSESINMFQIDAAVNPGNSGGPVYNAQGQVIGIVTAKYSDTGIEGLGFAIPINEAASMANDLITKGYVTGKAYMGVQIDRRYNSMYSQYYGMPIGAYVDSVVKGSCAARAGLQAGDIITQLGEQTVTSYDELRTAIRQFSAGDSAQMTFYRAGESLTVEITFDEEQPNSGAYSASSSAGVYTPTAA